MSEWFSWTNGTYPNFLDPTSIHCCPKAIVLKTTSFRWTATKIPMILTPFAFLSSGTAWPSVISTSWSPSSWGRGSCGKTASRTSGWLASSWGFADTSASTISFKDSGMFGSSSSPKASSSLESCFSFNGEQETCVGGDGMTTFFWATSNHSLKQKVEVQTNDYCKIYVNNNGTSYSWVVLSSWKKPVLTISLFSFFLGFWILFFASSHLQKRQGNSYLFIALAHVPQKEFNFQRMAQLLMASEFHRSQKAWQNAAGQIANHVVCNIALQCEPFTILLPSDLPIGKRGGYQSNLEWLDSDGWPSIKEVCDALEKLSGK